MRIIPNDLRNKAKCKAKCEAKWKGKGNKWVVHARRKGGNASSKKRTLSFIPLRAIAFWHLPWLNQPNLEAQGEAFSTAWS